MCAQWNSDIDRGLVIDAISRIAFVNEHGGASFTGIAIQRYIPMLISAVEFDRGIPPSLHHDFVWSAVCDAVKAGKLDANNLKRLVCANERAYLKEPVRHYILLTAIGLKLPKYPLRIRIGGTTLVFTQRYPKRFDRKPVAHQFSSAVAAELPKDYCWVRVSISGRRPKEAAECGLEALDLLRGIWNFGLTFQTFRMSFPACGPANKILPGPIHTLHSPDGTLATKLYWYEPSYRKPTIPYDVSAKFDRLRGFEKRVRQQLRSAKEKCLLIHALIRYVRAQDEWDLNNMFLSLWSLLETLTDTLKLSYDKTIRRAAFIGRDRAFAMQELNHLRIWRNKTVHLGKSSEDRQSHVNALKAHVDELLAFLLLNPDNRRKSLEEIALFLDVPHDAETLTQRIELYQKALKLHGGK